MTTPISWVLSGESHGAEHTMTVSRPSKQVLSSHCADEETEAPREEVLFPRPPALGTAKTAHQKSQR